MQVFFDLRCLQHDSPTTDPAAQHALSLLGAAREGLSQLGESGGLRLYGLADEELPAIRPEIRCLVDDVLFGAVNVLERSPALFIQLSPMSGDQGRMAPLLGRSNVFKCAVIADFHVSRAQNRTPAGPEWLRGYDLYLCAFGGIRDRLKSELGVPETAIEVTGIDLSDACSPQAGAPYTADLATGSRPYVVMAADPRAPEAVAEALKAFREIDDAAALVILGDSEDGGLPAWLGKLLVDEVVSLQDVRFVDSAGDGLLRAGLYRNAAATVVPGPWESCSLAAIEAVMAGSPVLIAAPNEKRDHDPGPPQGFAVDSSDQLAVSLRRLIRSPDAREKLIARQKPLTDTPHEDVYKDAWIRVSSDFRGWLGRKTFQSRAGRSRVALLTPWPPEAAPSALYAPKIAEALSKYATVDVFTNTAPQTKSAHVNNFKTVSAEPYLSDEYDGAIAVLGRSPPAHARIFGYASRYGGACIITEPETLGLAIQWRGMDKAVERATRVLDRPVEAEELAAWVVKPQGEPMFGYVPWGALPEECPVLAFDDFVYKASALIVHGAPMVEKVKDTYSVCPQFLPPFPLMTFSESELREERQRIRQRFGFSDKQVIIAAFRYDDRMDAPLECIWTMDQLRSWGFDTRLYFLELEPDAADAVKAAAAELGVEPYVSCPRKDSLLAYRQLLLAADFGIQLRACPPGEVSASLLDCISAGLPAVANANLADAVEGPSYVVRIPNALSAFLAAEAIAVAHSRGIHRNRATEERTAYLETHNVDYYAHKLASAVGIA